MTKHLTVRMAWHDNGWDGGICKDPEGNVYCTGSHSLLSPRIQRRIRLDIESNRPRGTVTEVQNKTTYFPPCYWSINAQSPSGFTVHDPHPFSEGWNKVLMSSVKPLTQVIEPHTLTTWCFKLGFSDDDPVQKYAPPSEMASRTRRYLEEIETNNSIVFMYANYSNPVSGDFDKYLLVGAGIANSKTPPGRYDIPPAVMKELRSGRGMANLGDIPWQFQVTLSPDTVVMLPYQDYVDWVDGERDQSEHFKRWNRLKEIAITINEHSIIPHFKYVSMQLSNDKALFLLYKMLKAVDEMKKGGPETISSDRFESLEDRIIRLLEHAWKLRGKYPGLKNLLRAEFKDDLPERTVEELLVELDNALRGIGGAAKLLDSNPSPSLSVKLQPIMRKIKAKLEQFRFLARFDFSALRFGQILFEMNYNGPQTILQNPYALIEKFSGDVVDSWNSDQSDYGLNLFQLDMGLIPDPDQGRTDWDNVQGYEAKSTKRLRAIVYEILRTAGDEGNTCLTRDEILEAAAKYPLYYINRDLTIGPSFLAELEKTTTFTDKFELKRTASGETFYQLKEVRRMESTIEEFVGKASRKRFSLTETQSNSVKLVARKESEDTKGLINADEQNSVYRNALENGLFVLSGKAGSGKTTALATIVKLLKDQGAGKIFVFTPTGKANIVVKGRLKQIGLETSSKPEGDVFVSTIHRFLYTALWGKKVSGHTGYASAVRVSRLVESILDGAWELLEDLQDEVNESKFLPKVVIIDEASMVDEVLLSLLFSLIGPNNVDHLILVGDERQLPPIGMGRPFVDIIRMLDEKGLRKSYAHMVSSLRFDPRSSVARMAEFFAHSKAPSTQELGAVLDSLDETVQVKGFNSDVELRKALHDILTKECGVKDSPHLTDMFNGAFKLGADLDLEAVQLLSARRTGKYGTMRLNVKIIREGDANFTTGSKVICEKNFYLDAYTNLGKKERVLGLTNGSIGYVKDDAPYFQDLEDLKTQYKSIYDWSIKGEISPDSSLKSERSVDFGYAISVHKSQGSGFGMVVLVIAEATQFLTRELLYTAMTRPEKKLILLVESGMMEDLPAELARIHSNSAIESRSTGLFEFTKSPYRKYQFTPRNGKPLVLNSKIELEMAAALDSQGADFEYEPMELWEKWGMKPDFRINFDDGRFYYIEHLGRMEDLTYRERWYAKLKFYEMAGCREKLATTSEGEGIARVDEVISKILKDMRLGTLGGSEGYSKHHYLI